jgi:carboxypeptidase C (cathepsin A)
MQVNRLLVCFSIVLGCCATARPQEAQTTTASDPAHSQGTTETSIVVKGAPVVAPPPAPPIPDSVTDGEVTIAGKAIAYRAVAGTITVGGTEHEDTLLGLDGRRLPDSGEKPLDPAKPEEAPATARMFYAAYFAKGVSATARPVTFFFNGGPGSSTMWLHMGSFGPRRVIAPDAQHASAAPYSIVNNQYSLLDRTDLVFIDAPGTGLSRIFGKDKEKAFWGVDPDAHAFDRFIRRFLTKHQRWNSPKYVFGESYGTPRAAVLSAVLDNIDLNGIVLLSAILSFDNSVDGPRWNPGVDQPYALALPTYAASAFYHHKLPSQPPALDPFLKEVEKFALGEYMSALLQGSELPDTEKQAVAAKLHEYTGLPVAYLIKANLRVNGGEFSKTLQDPEGLTTGRLDTRYQGPDINPLSEEAEYDPQSTAISSAYTSAINEYLRSDLKYATNQTYKPSAYGEPGFIWDHRHQAPGGPPADQGESGTNVMPDLAYTMKLNPRLKILLAGGYYDLATPFFEGMYEMHHLPMPQNLQSNITYRYYPVGHMVYVNEGVLKQFHDDVAAFLQGTK